jgi:NodT family efflux transporter outer membrane factor (OMF) lipoprotein
MTARLRGALAVLAAFTAGCAVGPDYERPDFERPAVMPAIAAVTSEETGFHMTDKEPWERWWEVFHDPQLERLVGEARGNNQDLRAAVARVHAARAVMHETFAPLLPTIGATGQYTYQKQSQNAILLSPGTGSVTGTPTTGTSGLAPVQAASISGSPFQLWAGTGDLTYELDLWGRIRRNFESAKADTMSFEEDRKSIEITVMADVAQTYFDLGEADADLTIAQEAVVLRDKTLALVRGRFDAGLAAELELRRAEGELATAEADVPEAERQRAVAEHRLAILIGRMPDLSFAGRPPASFDLPPEVPVGIPARLLERRPDIRSAEEHLHAANARIGEAIAHFFPTVTIVGRAGYASLSFSSVAQGPAQLWSIGPSIRIPIFEGGQTYYRVIETEARTDEATANYYKAILNAFGEVADSIVGIGAHARVRDRQHEAVVAQERAVGLATIEYDQGLTNYLNVLDAQRSLLTARQALVRAQRLVLYDLVQLQKALGGGWTELEPDSGPSTALGTVGTGGK